MSPVAMRRFWTMIAHYNGQIWNSSEVASSLGMAPNTARSYMDALEQTFMVRQLQPWFANVKKRLVKTPKLYFRDSVLFHAIQDLELTELWVVYPGTREYALNENITAKPLNCFAQSCI